MQASVKQYIDQLDLGYIIDTLCAEGYPLPRWTRTDAEQCCRRYKNFLFLQKKYPEVKIVPPKDVDEFWHQHILHTERYIHDCQQIFGGYLHHVPISMHDDMKKLTDDFVKTKQLYWEEFKEIL